MNQSIQEMGRHSRGVWRGLLWSLLCGLVLWGGAAWAQADTPGLAPASQTAQKNAKEGAQSAKEGAQNAKEGAQSPAQVRPFKAGTPKALPDLSAQRGRPVLVIPIHGTIEPGLVPFVKRTIEESPNPALVVLDVDTFGGRVDSATEIRDLILGLSAPTVAYVNRRAISAGALISLAAEYLVFSEGATLGAATPIQQAPGGEAQAVGEKMVSYMRAEMRATAEARGHNGDLAEAMVDADIAIEGVVAQGKLLTVTSALAQELGLASARQPTLSALLDAVGLQSATVVRPEQNWAESIARFLTDPAVSGILMLIGMLGLYLELSTPGIGLPGLIGILALSAFFGGHMVVALAGWEEILLFGLGIGLLAVEIFFIPGFGVVGVIGLLVLGAALVMAMINLPMNVALESGILMTALTSVLLALVGSLVLFFVALRYLPDSRLASGLMLKTSLAGAEEGLEGGGWGHEAPGASQLLVGREGEALTDLRPAGKVSLDGETAVYDVVGQLTWITRGSRVRVVEVDGVRIIVTAVPQKTAQIAQGAAQAEQGAAQVEQEAAQTPEGVA